MSSELKRRGKYGIYYANVSFMGVRLRDCLKTVIRDEAQRRLIELKLAVERGDFQKTKIKFEDLKYEPSDIDKEGIYRKHLMPAFKGQTLAEIDLAGWLQGIADVRPRSSVVKVRAVLKELGFELPKVVYRNLGKRFDDTQILTEEQVLDVIHNFVSKKYQSVCLVAAYSTLRLSDVLNLKKRNVDFQNGWVRVKQGKTQKSVSIPISNKLREAFMGIKVIPMNAEDPWFPGIIKINLIQSVKRAFTKAGIKWGSFHSFRHWGACHLIMNGVPLEMIQKLLGHSSITTTQIYARVRQDALKQAVKAFDTSLTQVGGQ